MKSELKDQIRKWVKDYERTQPSNVCIDDEGFEGSAYFLLCGVLKEINDPDRITIHWHIDDVIECAKRMGKRLTKQQARDVLSFIDHKHDAGVGINWDVIGCAIDNKVWEN